MSTENFELPDVGEGLTEAEIVSWHVKAGDTVELNQTLCEIETAKSIVELPSPFEGRVVELFASEGQTVDVGKFILSIETAGAEGAEAPGVAPEAPAVDLEFRRSPGGCGLDGFHGGCRTGGQRRPRRLRTG